MNNLKKKPIFVLILIISLTVCIMLFSLTGCFFSGNDSPSQTQAPEQATATPSSNPSPTPDTNGDTEEQDEPQYTEAEYRDMCIEKIEEITKNYIQNKYSKELTNFKFETIDTLNGLIYIRGYVNGNGNNFIAMYLDKEKTNVETFKKLYNGFLKNATHNDINSLKAEQDLSKLVTTESYNAFLNSIIIDQLFVNSLNEANIQIENEIIKWQDIATVSNAKQYSNQEIDVTFVNLNNNKTIKVRVGAYLTLQESSEFQSMVDNMANKNKSYEIVSVSDYYTID